MEEEKTPKFMIGSNGYYFYYGNRVSQEEYQRLFYMDKVDKIEQTLAEILKKLDS